MPKDNEKNRKILITGASGLVGTYIVPLMAEKYRNLFVTAHEAMPKLGTIIQINLSDTDQVSKMLRELRPDIILNLAALTDVDSCEIDMQMATLLNRDLCYVLARYTASAKTSYLLHVSTDYVFDGSEGNYSEGSQTNPINWYGKTKLAGENEIIRNVSTMNWCIARTSTPFGVHPKKLSFPIYILSKLRNEQSVKALSDQITSPTYGPNLGKMLLELVERRIRGIFHIAGKNKLSRYEQAKIVADVFDLDAGLIVRASIAEMNWKAKRPKNSSLNVERAIAALYNKPQSFHHSIKNLSHELDRRHNKFHTLM
jgi:dTDP-4-dehydrorhamnose reductase